LKIIAITNQKGGVGKTTTTTNLGAALALKGKKVLVVDLDPQAHLTTSLGVKEYELEKTIYEVFKGVVSINEAIIDLGRPKSRLWLLPSSLTFSVADTEFSSEAGREYLLKEALQSLNEQFDYILIDCPPSLGLLTINGFTAAQEIYIPLQTEFLAMHGMTQLLQVYNVVKKRVNQELKITGIIGTIFDGRKKLNREVVDKIREHFGEHLFKTLIRSNVSLAEAPSFGQDIFTYRPDSTGAEDYAALAEEVLQRS
jgi:chromosome partitioning protein